MDMMTMATPQTKTPVPMMGTMGGKEGLPTVEPAQSLAWLRVERGGGETNRSRTAQQ